MQIDEREKASKKLKADEKYTYQGRAQACSSSRFCMYGRHIRGWRWGGTESSAIVGLGRGCAPINIWESQDYKPDGPSSRAPDAILEYQLLLFRPV